MSRNYSTPKKAILCIAKSILESALEDLVLENNITKQKIDNRQTAINFFESGYYKDICDIANLDDDRVKNKYLELKEQYDSVSKIRSTRKLSPSKARVLNSRHAHYKTCYNCIKYSICESRYFGKAKYCDQFERGDYAIIN